MTNNAEYSYKVFGFGSKSMRVRWDVAENSDESQRHGGLKNKELMTKNILQLDLLVTKGIRT
jgi:hypothetical protein